MFFIFTKSSRQRLKLKEEVKMKETRAAIKGYEGLYEISNLGRVRSLNRIIEMNIKKG